MNKLPELIIILLLFISCTKQENKKEVAKLSDAEQIAKAYGIDNIANIKHLQYTFNIQKDDTLRVSRSWQWDRESGEITLISKQDTTTYQQNAVNDALKNTDHRFINDKYWLLFPFQLVWDNDLTITNSGKQKAPISNKLYTKITAQYGDKGGYTPGDAYDLYVDDQWLIREWTFRKGGQEKPSLSTTWEGYHTINGIKISTIRNNNTGDFSIFFTDVVFK